MGPNEKKLRATYKSYGLGDMEAILNAFDEDVVWKSNGAGNRLLFPGERKGREGVRAYARARDDEWTIVEHEVLEMLGSGDERFAVRVRASGQHLQTGEKATITRADFITMKDGLITSFEEIFDTAPLERAARPR